MRIASYVYLFIGLVVFTLAALGVIALLAIDRTNYYRQRADHASAQVDELLDLARSATHLSEHVAEYFAFNRATLEEIEHGNKELRESLTSLREATTKEAAHLRTKDELAKEQEDAIRIQTVFALLARAESQIGEMIQLKTQGRGPEAIAFLEREFSGKTMSELERVLSELIEEERNEAAEARGVADRYWAWPRGASIAFTVCMVAAVMAAAWALLRKLSAPIAALTEGAGAFAGGNFAHRISLASQDEFGALANSFNDMAAALEQRTIRQDDSKRELERMVDERTRALTLKAEELDEANGRLAQVNKLRTQFLADISHELRTPLTTLRGEAELALRSREKSAAPYRGALTKVLGVSETMGRLIDDLLFLARSETDTLRFDIQSVDLREVAQAALADAEVLARSKGVVVRHSVADGRRMRVEGDPVRIKQVLLIALDNAIKYSAPGKAVDFSLNATGARAEFAIRDSGAGIAKEDLPYVFERFYRSKREKSLPSGFGLGLSIAKWIVDKHGGRIGVESEPGAGTELKMSFALIESRATNALR